VHGEGGTARDDADEEQAKRQTCDIMRILSAEIIEKIGARIQCMRTVGWFNSITAMRKYGHPYLEKEQRMPASAVAMMSLLLLKGTRNRSNTDGTLIMADIGDDLPAIAPVVPIDDALIFSATDRIVRQGTEHTRCFRVLSEIIARYPLALVSQNRKGCTPLHEYIKRRTWQIPALSNSLLVGKDSALRSALGVEQRLIQNRKGLTPLHSMLKYMYFDENYIKLMDTLIDTDKKVLLVPDAKGRIPLQRLLSVRNHAWVKTNFIRSLLYDLPGNSASNDLILRHNNEHGGTCLHYAIMLAAFVRRFGKMQDLPQIDLPQIIPLLVDSDASVLLMHQEENVYCDVDRIHRLVSHIPLHLAILHSMELSVIDLLIDKDKRVLSERTAADTRGFVQLDTPLHLAIRLGRGLELVKMLIDTHGDVLSIPNFQGNTPLRLALQRRGGPHDFYDNVILYLIERALAAQVSFVQTDGRSGDTMLHMAIRRGASDIIIKTLVESENRVRTLANTRGDNDTLRLNTPLHEAMIKQSCIAVLKQLVDDEQDVLLMANSLGELPLHLVDLHHSVDIISLLIPTRLVEPDVRTMQDASLSTPLHRTLASRAECGVIKALFDPARNVLYLTDNETQTPLHIAAACFRNNESPESRNTIMTIVNELDRVFDTPQHSGKKDPRACYDNNGDTPLCIAINNGCR